MTRAVIAFFQGFLREEGQTSTGQPSLARGQPVSPSKRTYTGEQISQLYAAHRKGAYRGRETEWARQEADIIAAGGEGRVLGHPYITK